MTPPLPKSERSHRTGWLSLVMICSGAPLGCADVGDLLEVRDALAAEFQLDSPSVYLQNSRHLILALGDSELVVMTGEARSAHARDVAAFAAHRAQPRRRVDTVSVLYFVHDERHRAGWRQFANFTFSKEDFR